MPDLDLEHLRPFATAAELRVLDEMVRHQSMSDVARALGYKTHSGVFDAIRRLRARAALRNVSPQHDFRDELPENFRLKRRSDMRENSLGKPVWIISEPSREYLTEHLRLFMESLAESVPPAPLTPPPSLVHGELLAVYPLGDPHFGMRAWAREAGENFDLKIADRLTRSAIDRLVSTTLPARHALLINLGDFFHADDNSARTPEHGNKLDVDGRYDLVLTTGALCLVHCVQWLLERHEEVTVWSLPGNHDPHSALALSLALKMFFHNEPRVNIEVDPSLFRFLRFGRNLIGATHGHGPKIADLPSIMADERPEDWGKTEHRVWWVGHFHNRKAWEMRGCDIQIARTLASADAWHASKGYKAMREVRSVVYHYDHGEWQQQRVSPGMIAAGV